MFPAPLTDLIICAAWGLMATALALAFVNSLIQMGRLLISLARRLRQLAEDTPEPLF